MKAILLLLGLLLWQVTGAPPPEPRYFQYERTVAVAPESASGQACATLDGSVYAHGAPSLKDVRLYEGAREVPYAITLSESAEADSEPATVLNLGMRGTKLAFDLAMPDRAYTDVLLDLAGQDFIASAEVSGTNQVLGANQPGETPTRLGTFTLFDLTGQHLSRSTTLHLQESRFHTLHVELSVSPAPEAAAFVASPAMVRGASVPPSREAQTVYTTVAATGSVQQQGHQTVATFRLPAHVPVERVSFAIAPAFTGNFSRDVQVSDRAEGAPESAAETQSGTILRVQMQHAGREIKQQQLSIPATLGANLQKDALVEVRIENGNDIPLPVSAISLEMRQRRLCFNIPAAAGLTLFYGDAALDAPVYDFARVLSLSRGFAAARLGAEERNPAYVVRPLPDRALTERHPELLWIVLLAVVCVLAAVATHSAKKMPR